MILNDRSIRELACPGSSCDSGMIWPFDPSRLNSFGYDLTLSDEFLIPVFDYVKLAILDPLAMGEVEFRNFKGDSCIIPPNSFVLGKSVEVVRMPSNITGVCLGRSSYARCGVIVNTTPLEAGWHGTVTIEISNSTPLPVKAHAHKGICQVLFFEGRPPERDYVQKGGRYQDQAGVTPAKGL